MRHSIREVLDFHLQNWEMVGGLRATKFVLTCYSSIGAKKTVDSRPGLVHLLIHPVTLPGTLSLVCII